MELTIDFGGSTTLSSRMFLTYRITNNSSSETPTYYPLVRVMHQRDGWLFSERYNTNGADFIIDHHTCWWHLGCSCFFSSLSHLFFSSRLVISSCLVPCFHPILQFLCWSRQQHDTSWQVTCCFGLSTEQKNPIPIHCLYFLILWLSCSATTRSVVACLTFIDTEL